MVRLCSVYNCTERQEPGSSLSFHVFPQDLIWKKKWILAVQGKNFIPLGHHRVCSKHFTPDSFINNGWSKKMFLKNDAVPTIFDFPSPVTEKTLIRKFSLQKHDSQNVKNGGIAGDERAKPSKGKEDSPIEPPVKKKILFYVGDFKEPGSTRDNQYRATVAKVLENKEKQMTKLLQCNKQLMKEVVYLKPYLLDHLKQERMIDEDVSLKLPVSDTIDVIKNEIEDSYGDIVIKNEIPESEENNVNEDLRVSEAFEVPQTVNQSIQERKYDIFAAGVASKLKKIKNEHLNMIVQRDIGILLYDALNGTGNYENIPSSSTDNLNDPLS